MSEKFLQNFGPVLRNLRHAKALTQGALGELVGVSDAYISMLESGQNLPNLELLCKLSGALGVNPSEIFIAMEQRAAGSMDAE